MVTRRTRALPMSDPAATVYDVIHGDEYGPALDWREMIVRMTDLCLRRTYGFDHDSGWSRSANRRALEDLLDLHELPPGLAASDLQDLVQTTIDETERQHAIVGAALVMAWPSDPRSFGEWPDRAIALATLATDARAPLSEGLGRRVLRRVREAARSH